ncbi:rod shape-determining protein MreD [Neobacillus notoginsengisoli]|uniref:Rod shape-determining protein MreD n=1 Tax=Neobacillus notoginsengisoli TaxID=1578198 RepID=A0A417YU19_9BACI|nr:rod shape-determining protein MreD [Neobacillus notoginsengisoli]RHW40632.1 rod shape-determining protein MreD [Neobacillus notoginsengisoli]
MNRFFLPLLLFLFFTLESIFVQLLPTEFFYGKWILVPRFLMVVLLLLAIYGSQKYAILYGFAFGLLFDIVYTEIIGVYLFLLPLTIYFVMKAMKVLQTNILVVAITVMAGISLLEMVIYKLNHFLHITNLTFSEFSQARLLPVICLNLLFLVLAFYPLKQYFEKLAEQESLL